MLKRGVFVAFVIGVQLLLGSATSQPRAQVISTTYCISGSSTNLPYEWWVDLGDDRLNYSTEPGATAAAVAPGAPASTLASAFAAEISANPRSIARGVSAVASVNCFDIFVSRVCSGDHSRLCMVNVDCVSPPPISGTCIALPGALLVGPAGTQPPTCVVTSSGCTYNPTITQGCTTNAQCDDLNPCTDDICDATFHCVYANNASPCTDGDLCTSSDSCSNGLCVPGAPANCDDSNACTDDSCDPQTGLCANTPIPPPGLVPNLTVSSGVIAWGAVSGSGMFYDIVRGLGSELPVGSGANELCLIPGGTTALSTTDNTPSPLNDYFWYVVRARDSCAPGSYSDINGQPRATATCP